MRLCLNVGSGEREFKSVSGYHWLNIDAQVKPGFKPDIIADGRSLPFAEGEADIVVLHHVWEHLGCGEGADLIREAHRVLKRGGILIVTIPHMKALAQRWLCGMMDDQLFFTNVYGAFHGDEHDRHRWAATKEGLIRELELALFMVAKEFDWRPIPGASIVKDWWILGVEGIK